MDILKAFSLFDTEHPVNIQGTLENPLFQANQIGKILSIRNMHTSLTDFDEEEKVTRSTGTLGGSQETTFLTEIGLYKFIGRSKKTIAATFQKWMIHVLREIRITGMYKLQQDKEIDKKLIEHNCALINHNTLIKAYYKKSVVYLCKLKDVEDKFVIKIGSTQNIKERMYNLANNHNSIEPLLLDIFECEDHTKFERFLHKHAFISNYYHKIEIKNGEVSKETYLVNLDQYNEMIKIINGSKELFRYNNSKEVEEIRLHTEKLRIENGNIVLRQKELENENEKIKLRRLEIELELKKLEILQPQLQQTENSTTATTTATATTDVLEYTEEDTSLDTMAYNYKLKKRSYSSNTPRVYQYHPDDLTTPIKMFEAPADVERTLTDISPGPLKISSKNNTIYKGYRWFYTNRSESPPQTIPATIANKNKSPDVHFIAMVDVKKTKIMAVYSNQKDAILARNMKCNSFTRAIAQESLSSGHYWYLFDKCSQEMKDEYLSHSQLPEKYVPQTGKRVQQIDPKTNKILNTYNSNREVVKLFQIASNTLKKISQTGDIHNGFIWKIV